ncbi:MAG TPA: GNAT family N-acetyltransferase [Acidimicrobiales bacterium]|nr:GNAT family N-acetyltransferase [Acidimicrobiales bacterium]
MSIVVRPAEVHEYGRVAGIMLAAYGSLPGFRLEGPYAEELADVAGRATSTVQLVAVDDTTGEIVGAVTYLDDAGSPYAQPMEQDEAALRMLAVDPVAQRRGVGAALVRSCIDLARRHGRERLVLHTTEWMTAGHRLYERLGFRRTPERDALVGDRIHLQSYVLDLAP